MKNVARSSEARLDPAQISQLTRDGAPEFAQCRPLLAQTWQKTQSMSLLGVKRTCRFALHMSAYDPKRTSAGT